MAERHLQLVDTDTGELVPECPDCQHRETTIEGLQHEIRSLAAKLRQAHQDRDAAARKDEIWPQAVGLFRYWQDRTGHKRAKFTTERFELVAPHIRREGAEACRNAIDGCLASDWHQKRGPAAKRTGPIHDAFSTVFGKQDAFERFRDMAEPRISTIRGQARADRMRELAHGVAGRVLELAREIERADPADLTGLAVMLAGVNRELTGWIEEGKNAEVEPDRQLC